MSVDSRTRALLARIASLLAARGVKGYLVGGLVRDMLYRRTTADIDIAVTGDALSIARDIAAAVKGKFITLDEANGVARIIVPPDEENAGWQIDLNTATGGIEDDLRRRDFTIDAMAISLEQIDSGQLIDPFGGQQDIASRVVRATGERALAADPIRLLRGVRLAAELGFAIEPGTELLTRRFSPLIAGVSGERIREELLRLLGARDCGRWLRYLDNLGLLTAVIPELSGLRGVGQPKEHFWDVFDHSLEAVAAAAFLLRQGEWEHAAGVLADVPWSEEIRAHFGQEVSAGSTRGHILKLAALLHDIAKPRTKAPDATGRIRFLGHALEGSAVVVAVMERLRFSSREIRLAETLVRHHLRPGQLGQDWQPTRRAIYRYFRDTGDGGIDTLYLSLADHLATRGLELDMAEFRGHAGMVEYILAERSRPEVALPPRLITGHDLANTLGMSPGPGMGELLEAVREAQAAGELSSREEALDFARHYRSSRGE